MTTKRLELPPKLIPVFAPTRGDLRYRGAYGGRGSGKSYTFAKMAAVWGAIEKLRILCTRELQNSIKESFHAEIKNAIFSDDWLSSVYDVGVDYIRHKHNGTEFIFRGLRHNMGAIKSMAQIDLCIIEEAEDVPESSWIDLLPTIRAPKSEIWVVWNPKRKNSPVDKRFIQSTPPRSKIVEMNYKNNPWFPAVLNEQRLDDEANWDDAVYQHVWNGDYNDAIENSLIKPGWLDACLDAHIKLGFKPQGIEIVAHDPSDTGPDPKGLAYRHGSVIVDVKEKHDGDVNEGNDWALGYAIQNKVDHYIWDVGGMGIALKRDVDNALSGKKINAMMFNGAESVSMPNAIYQATDNDSFAKQKTNSEVFRNKRSQMYAILRNKVYNTYMAVVHDRRVIDESELISFSSNIDCWTQLRAELSRLPLVDNSNGYIQIMSKKDMIKPPLSIPSPNLADSVMMTMDTPPIQNAVISSPPPRRKQVGRR